MLTLSIRQPWAWLILHAGKDIENRSWATKVRGRILIHASKGMTRDEYEDAMDTARMARSAFPTGVALPGINDLQRGGIIGSVEITGCVIQSPSRWFFGPFGFNLANPQPLIFLPCKGRLGFFDVPEITRV